MDVPRLQTELAGSGDQTKSTAGIGLCQRGTQRRENVKTAQSSILAECPLSLSHKLLYHFLNWIFTTLQIPKIYWNLSTSRVLTMEYCQGENIGDFAQNTQSKLQSYKMEISKKVTQLFSEMIFLHGFIHCDPHPGNLRIDLDAKGKLVVHLLDHGLYSVINFIRCNSIVHWFISFFRIFHQATTYCFPRELHQVLDGDNQLRRRCH